MHNLPRLISEIVTLVKPLVILLVVFLIADYAWKGLNADIEAKHAANVACSNGHKSACYDAISE